MKSNFGLPLEVKFCKKCVISNQRPVTLVETKHSNKEKKKTTNFDENGICDACNWSKIKKSEINWEEREKKLLQLLKFHRSKKGNYDVVVPSSGGKDSIYVAHILKYKYKMNPLTVTWAPHIYTEIGKINFYNMIENGFDNILITPNSKVHKLLTKLAFLNLGHPFQPFIIGQRVVGPKVAIEKKIPLVFYGENVAEYGNNLKDNYSPLMDKNLITAFDIDNENLLLSGVKIKKLKSYYKLSNNDLEVYRSPKIYDLDKLDVQVHYMSYYRNWSPQDNFYYASQNTNFKVANERTQGTYTKSNGLDDKLECFHYYMMLIKFGLGRATWDAAQEIRDGKISRDEGVNLVKKYDHEFPEKSFQDFLDYISIDKEIFFKTIDGLRNKNIWKKKSNFWKLKYNLK
jgi:N-acetyl sugar amidotransferase